MRDTATIHEPRDDDLLHVWVLDGIIQPCAHPPGLAKPGKPCCAAYTLAGQRLDQPHESDRSKSRGSADGADNND